MKQPTPRGGTTVGTISIEAIQQTARDALRHRRFSFRMIAPDHSIDTVGLRTGSLYDAAVAEATQVEP